MNPLPHLYYQGKWSVGTTKGMGSFKIKGEDGTDCPWSIGTITADCPTSVEGGDTDTGTPANAALIAAAPDLVRSIEQIMPFLEALTPHVDAPDFKAAITAMEKAYRKSLTIR